MKKLFSRIVSVTLTATLAVGLSYALAEHRVTLPPNLEGKAKASLSDDVAEQFAKIQPRPFGSATSSSFHAVAKAAPARLAPGEAPGNLLGTLISADSWEDLDDEPVGFYSVPANATATPQSQFGISGEGFVGGVLVDGVYYINDFYSYYGYLFTNNTYGYDIQTGEKVYDTYNGTSDWSTVAVSATLNPADKKVYAITYTSNGRGYQLSTLEFAADGVNSTTIAALDGNWNSIAADAAGQLYAIRWLEDDGDLEGSTLVKLDAATGTVTEVGETGVVPKYNSDAIFVDGKLFWTVSNFNGSFMYEVDPATGVATQLYQFADNEEFIGLALGAPEAADNAPAAVTGLAAEFPDGGLEGSVNFTAPATTFDGTAAEGALTYTILLDGEEFASGSTEFAAAVSVLVTVATEGQHTFEVYVSNEAGQSPSTAVSVYVGKGAPKPAENVALVFENGDLALSWDAVTESADGGYFDAAAVTYKVTRLTPTEEVLAENLAATSFVEHIGEPTSIQSYRYSVVAQYEGKAAVAVNSNTVVVGSEITPPYFNSFDNASALDGWTVIDNNYDGKTWSFYELSGNGTVRARYSGSNDMDDWFITPGIRLEAGKSYTVAYKTRTGSMSEVLEVKWGKAATIGAMTNVLVAENEYETTKFVDVTAMLIPEEDGTYFIGFHGLTESDHYYIYVDDFSITAGADASAPAAVTDLAAVDANSDKNVTVSFNAPAIDLAGSAIASVDRIEVLRQGVDAPVKVFENVAAGQLCSFVDAVPSAGNYTYTVVAYKGENAGTEASVTVRAGVDLPGAVDNATIVETSNLGEVTVSWDAVTTDRSGNPLDASQITYAIYIPDGDNRIEVATGLTATSHTFRAVAEGEQDFAQYLVYAATEAGEGVGDVTPAIPVGTPVIGLQDSFADGKPAALWGLDASNGGVWSVYGDDNETFSITSVDGDNGFIACRLPYWNNSGDIFTGKISLEGIANPTLTFYRYVQDENDINVLQILVREIGGDYQSVYRKGGVEMASAIGWNKGSVDLSAYAGKTIQICFRAIKDLYDYVFLDNIEIQSLANHDVKAVSIAAPESVKVGNKYSVNVVVAGNGYEAAEGAALELYANEELAATAHIPSLAYDATAIVSFELTMDRLAEEPVVLLAKVAWDKDEIADNNSTDDISVAPVVSNRPIVTDLQGSLDNQNRHLLNWSAPDLSDLAAEVYTESFEDGETFGRSFEGWTFLDIDGAPVGVFDDGLPMPGIDNQPGSFFVFDNSVEEAYYYEGLESHSGSKYLCDLYNGDGSTRNDWAISPELSGNAQTVTLYAKSFMGSYPEVLRVFWSDGSLDTDDFEALLTVDEVPEDWTKYSVELPAGAKRFAIRCQTTFGFALFIDDVTYEKATPAVVGYNVYRDGQKITDTPVAETTYVDETAEGNHTYRVTAVYNDGAESRGSNEVSLAQSGIADAAAAVSILGGNGEIVVLNAENLHIEACATDGRVIFSGEGLARTTISALRGIYVVRAGQKVAKVIVK